VAIAAQATSTVEDCRAAGARFESQAVETGCEARLDDYLDCIDERIGRTKALLARPGWSPWVNRSRSYAKSTRRIM